MRGKLGVDLFDSDIAPALALFAEAACSAHVGRGFEEEFDLRVGEDFGADVAPVHDDAAGAAHLAQLMDDRFAHFGDRRDNR